MPKVATKSKLAESLAEEEEGGFPPTRDERWASWSRPLWLWLGEETGRSWEEIKLWGEASGQGMSLLRQEVVWLEEKGLIEAVRLAYEKSSRAVWRWRRVRGTLDLWKSKIGVRES